MTVSISFDSVRLTGVTAQQLIVRAYGVQPFEIVGGPDWLSRERFDVIAKAPATSSLAEMNLMLRALLAERFKLAAHVEKRESPVFFLVTAREDGKPGPGLNPAANAGCGRRESPATIRPPDQCRMVIGVGMIEGTGQPLYSLTAALEKIVGRPVVDMTLLTGTFDFKLMFAADEGRSTVVEPGIDSPTRRDAPSVFTAVQEQLGLKLQSTPGLTDVLVIDSLERPTPD
jgi:uncharacterized protein (TIGR03435 family)